MSLVTRFYQQPREDHSGITDQDTSSDLKRKSETTEACSETEISCSKDACGLDVELDSPRD